MIIYYLQGTAPGIGKKPNNESDMKIILKVQGT
jgi:hypothetical protein